MSPASCSLFLLPLVLKLSWTNQGRASEGPPSCPTVSVLRGFRDRTVAAGTAFQLSVPPLAFQGPVLHYQVSLADDAGGLPAWLAYSAHTGTLQGLALREEGGDYALRVTAMGRCLTAGRCKACPSTASTRFHLRVLSRSDAGTEATLPALAPPMETSGGIPGCPMGEVVTTAALLLQVDPRGLAAAGRLRLVAALADYLHAAPASIQLLSFRDELTLRQENAAILAKGLTSPGPKCEALPRAEVLWPVGCGDFRKLPELVRVLWHNASSGLLSAQLGVPVRGWRVLRHGKPARSRRLWHQLYQTPTLMLAITPPNHASALTSLPDLQTIAWKAPTLTQTQATSSLMPSKHGLEVTALQQTLDRHRTAFSTKPEEIFSHTSDLLFVVSPVYLSDPVAHCKGFSTSCHHIVPSLHTTKYFAKDPMTSAAAPTDAMSATWLVNILSDQLATMVSSPTGVITGSSQSIAPTTFIPTMLASTIHTNHNSSVMDLEMLGTFQTAQLYPEESRLIRGSLPHNLFTHTVDYITKGPNSIRSFQLFNMQTSVTSHFVLETSFPQSELSSSSWFFKASTTTLPQSLDETFMTTLPQFQLQASMTLWLEAGNFKTTQSRLESSFPTRLLLKQRSSGTSILQFESTTPRSLWVATPDLVTGSTKQATSLAWSDNITETTLLYKPVASSLMTGNMITESARTTIMDQSNSKTVNLYDLPTSTLPQASSRGFGLQSSRSTWKVYLSLSTPQTRTDFTIPLATDKLSTPSTEKPSLQPSYTVAVKTLMPRLLRSMQQLLSDSVLYQDGPALVHSITQEAPLNTHSIMDQVPLNTHSTTEGVHLPLPTSQSLHGTIVPLPQQDLPDLSVYGSGICTQLPQPSRSGRTFHVEGTPADSSLVKARQTMELSLTDISFPVTSTFALYPSLSSSDPPLAAMPQFWAPTEEVPTDKPELATPEFFSPLTCVSQQCTSDPSYPFLYISATSRLLETKENNHMSLLSWFNLMETLQVQISSGPPESFSLLSGESRFMAVQPNSKGNLAQAKTTDRPISTAFLSTSYLDRHAPPNSAENSFTAVPAGGHGSLSGSAVFTAPPAGDHNTGSASDVSMLPILAFTSMRVMTPLDTPSFEYPKESHYVSLSDPAIALTIWPTKTLVPGHFSDTLLQPWTRKLTLHLESSIKQSTPLPTSPSRTSTGPSNVPQTVFQSIPVLQATVGIPFGFFIPSGTFFDSEHRRGNTFTLQISSLDGSPSGPESWLGLDERRRLLHGVPLESDLQFSPQQFLLLARDSAGLVARWQIVIELLRASWEPCHAYVLTTRNSLHSFLRERRRIEFFLEKVARFFNDSSAGHLALITLEAGSTVAAWYNFTECQPSGGAEGQCQERRIRSAWEMMRTEDGQVDPTFSLAMLPEFPIMKVGELSFGGVCISGSPAGTHSATDPSASWPGLFPWTTMFLVSLLVVCGLSVLVVLLIAALRCWKRHGAPSLWPSEIYPARSPERRALKPRLPPLFQEEVPPPPLQLWLNLTPLPQEDLSHRTRPHKPPLPHANFQ